MSLHGWNGTVEEDELSGSQGVSQSEPPWMEWKWRSKPSR